MGTKTTIDEHRLWIIFHHAYDTMVKCEEQEAQKASITNQQLLVLWMIEFIGENTERPVIITELVPYLNRSIASISAIIYRMEKKGLLKTTRDLPDRRSFRIEITPRGKRLYSEGVQYNRNLLKAMLSVFSPEEMKILTMLLTKFKDKASELCHIDGKPNPVLEDQEKILRFLNDEPNNMR